MARGSSWMKNKLAKMATPLYRERFLSNGEGEKPCFKRHETIGAANHVRDETQRLVDAYLAGNGKIKRVAATGESPSQKKRSTVCLGTTSPGRAAIRYGKAWNV